jgi:hypothetical protein
LFANVKSHSRKELWHFYFREQKKTAEMVLEQFHYLGFNFKLYFSCRAVFHLIIFLIFSFFCLRVIDVFAFFDRNRISTQNQDFGLIESRIEH